MKYFLGAIAVLFMSTSVMAQPAPLEELPHIHAIATSKSLPGRFYLATHEGLFLASDDGTAERVSAVKSDFMSMTVLPGGKGLLAGGHETPEKNLGVMKSVDGGMMWEKIGDGADGPTDFHVLAASIGNPDRIYGFARELQVSNDGGATWAVVGPPPSELFGLAVSSQNPDVLYAATRGGLMRSDDGGQNWKLAAPADNPATMVHVSDSGKVRAFVYGVGLVEAREPDLNWKTVNGNFNDRYLWDMAVDSSDANRLYALADTGALMTSPDGGINWTGLEGSKLQTSDNIAAGKVIYEDNCQACHGVDGVGEKPGEPEARDEYGFVAPALNNDAHGWHHTDRQLVETILEGSARNERMIAWKEFLAADDARQVVAYMKSLWNFRSLACQGPKHMACMR